MYKVKKKPDGNIARYKAKLVAECYTQELGIDYFETFNPVVIHIIVRLILAFATCHKWELRQLDIKNAFFA